MFEGEFIESHRCWLSFLSQHYHNVYRPQKILTACMLEIRDGNNVGLVSMDDLFLQLQVGVQNMEDAMIIQDFIKELWKETPNIHLRSILDDGISDMLEGNHEGALIQFCKIVESEPLYGEAWNKKVC